MPRYIDDKNINDFLCEGIGCNECSFNEIDGESGCLLFERIGKLPSADVVEVVRCRDCKKYDSHGHRCKWWNHGVSNIDWCSKAERRSDDEGRSDQLDN